MAILNLNPIVLESKPLTWTSRLFHPVRSYSFLKSTKIDLESSLFCSTTTFKFKISVKSWKSNSAFRVKIFATHYETLGISKEASMQEIKQAFRKLAAKYHPDVSKIENAQSTFCNVVKAYEILGDSEKKNAYDRALRFKSLRMKYQTVNPKKSSQRSDFTWVSPNFGGREDSQRTNFSYGQYYQNYAYSYWDVSPVQDHVSESQRRYEEERRNIAELRDKWRRSVRRKDLANESMRQTSSWNLNQLDFLFLWIFLALWSTRGTHTALVFLVCVLSCARSVASGYKISGLAAFSFGNEKGIWLGIFLVLLHRFGGNLPHKVVGTLVLSVLLGSYLLAFTPVPASVLCYLTYRCLKIALN